jgi:hypothetical protein
MRDEIVVGKIARVIEAIDPKFDGVVSIPVRGGTENFNAHATQAFKRGDMVQVTEYFPPRDVYVAALKG